MDFGKKTLANVRKRLQALRPVNLALHLWAKKHVELRKISIKKTKFN